MAEINLAIIRTINYAKKFRSNLTANEIEERLISKKNFSKNEISKLVDLQVKKEKNNSYYLNKLTKAKKIKGKIRKSFEDILFLGITGSVASGHPKKKDDIDFLVITKKNKLWRTRLFLRWWIFKKQVPHRKYNKKEKKDEYCFNLWLDETSMLIPKDRQNLKNSVDLVLIKPLINKMNTYERFVLVNDWAKRWVATPYQNKIRNFPALIPPKDKENNKLDELINRLYFWPQYWYMKRKIQGERVGLHEAFFHKPMVK